MIKSVKIAVLLGGNLGDTAAIFDRAVEKLRSGGVKSIRRSAVLKNPAVDCVPGTADFLNAALTGIWSGSAGELLALCQRIEREEGRPAEHSSRESRTLDLDLILFGDKCIDQMNLKVPHPRARQRKFVLGPLAEIAPDWRFPDSGESVANALKKLEAAECSQTREEAR